MLDAFASVGATKFDLTVTSCEDKKVSFRRAVLLEEIRRLIPDLLDWSAAKQRNVIIRPNAPPVFLQLDDLDEVTRDRLQSVSFLSLETSSGNYQSWIALSKITGKDFARRLKQGVGADVSASGATRVAGSVNFKRIHAPEFPRVTLHHVTAGRIAREHELVEIGLLTGSEVTPEASLPLTFRPQGAAKRWPSYELCIARAPLNREGSAPDTSRADFTFSMIAIDWGWNVEETAARLMEKSEKAKENGLSYALLTAGRAAEALARRRGS